MIGWLPGLTWAVAGWLMLAAAGAAGAGGFTLAWKLRGAEVAGAQQAVRDVAAVAAQAIVKADGEARVAEGKIASLQGILAITERWEKERSEDVQIQINQVASPVRECLSPATVSVLQRAENRGVPGNYGTRQPAGPPSTGPAAPPARPGGVSEQAMATWKNAAHRQYRRCTALAEARAETILSFPNVRVDPNR